MSYPYPYKSRLRRTLSVQQEGAAYKLWQGADVPSLATAITKPVVEIGGPSEDGFYFADNINFNTKPIITNISANPVPFSPEASELSTDVVDTFDATQMPYSDASVGIFLMSAMSLSSDWWVELPDDEKEKASPIFEREFIDAQYEMGQVAAGIMKPDTVKYAQRVQIYQEVIRCLDNGGLFFTDGAMEEISILRQLGFELITCLQVIEDYGHSYEFVAIKRV